MPAGDAHQLPEPVRGRGLGHLAQAEVDALGEQHVEQADAVAAGLTGSHVREGLGEPGGVVHLEQDVGDPRLGHPPVEVGDQVSGPVRHGGPSSRRGARCLRCSRRADQRRPQLGECPERLADRGRLVPELRFAGTGGFAIRSADDPVVGFHHRVNEEQLPLDGADRENREAAVVRELAEPVSEVALPMPGQPRDPMRRDLAEEAFRNIEAPEVLEAVQQPVGVCGIAARLELPEPDEPRHACVGRLFEQMLEVASKPGRNPLGDASFDPALRLDRRVGAEPFDRRRGRQDGSRASAGVDEPADQVLVRPRRLRFFAEPVSELTRRAAREGPESVQAATPASRRPTAPSRWTCSATPCERPASTTRSTSTTTSPPASATTGRASTAACEPYGRATCFAYCI